MTTETTTRIRALHEAAHAVVVTALGGFEVMQITIVSANAVYDTYDEDNLGSCDAVGVPDYNAWGTESSNNSCFTLDFWLRTTAIHCAPLVAMYAGMFGKVTLDDIMSSMADYQDAQVGLVLACQEAGVSGYSAIAGMVAQFGEGCERLACGLLARHRDALHSLASALEERRTLSGEEARSILSAAGLDQGGWSRDQMRQLFAPTGRIEADAVGLRAV